MLLAVIATGISTMPAMIQTTFDDIFWQIAEGRQVLLGHIPHDVPSAIQSGTWIDHEWLFEALAAATYDHHCYAILIVICACLAALVPVLIFASVRNEEDGDFGAGIAALCSAVIMF